MANVNMSDAQMSAIDRAIAAAKARKAAKEAAGMETAEGAEDSVDSQEPVKVAPKAKPGKEKKAPKTEKVVPSKEDKEKEKEAKKVARAEAKAKIEKERAVRKAAKVAEKEAKKSEKSVVNVEPKHMAKVNKAAALLPKMNLMTTEMFEMVKKNGLTEGEVTTLCAHLAHYNRVRATIRSASCKFEEGQVVEIISSDRDARLIGKRGTIVEVRKIRVLVDVGTTNPAYLFLSDIVAVEEETEESVTEETVNEEVSDSSSSDEPEFLTPNDEEEEVSSEDATGTDNV